MNTFIAAAFLVINFGGYQNAAAVQIPMPSLLACQTRLAEIYKVNPTPIRYAMCISTDINAPIVPSKNLW